MVAASTLETPDGPFTVLADETAVLASGWTRDPEELRALIHPGLRPAEGSVEMVDDDDAAAPALLRQALAAAAAYYAGDLSAPRGIPVRQRSGPYRELAWEALRDVAPGERLTYSDYAAMTGRPAAVRAAAGACAMNAAALFVPCHRIVRTDGTLGGFRYGLPLKESLLGRESAADHTV